MTKKCERIQNAVEILIDPVKREEHDNKIIPNPYSSLSSPTQIPPPATSSQFLTKGDSTTVEVQHQSLRQTTSRPRRTRNRTSAAPLTNNHPNTHFLTTSPLHQQSITPRPERRYDYNSPLNAHASTNPPSSPIDYSPPLVPQRIKEGASLNMCSPSTSVAQTMIKEWKTKVTNSSSKDNP
ncbi:hypothetical protein CROQUDRAFT_130612 [Cronartium quercuum f. sp. fusiforme G11]|uniref:Uncharacterized protein n=1 Tax=Cronartium quercuum f. sp. fusiforme G11 TaxID=708437 RepID=A0A9P6TFH9_9BASI|nr:hypothetical protein CROQUDRAFT_130612 [Cronartium quercuum f. sp. fusiforme G11]